MLKKVFLLSILIGYLITVSHLDSAKGQEADLDPEFDNVKEEKASVSSSGGSGEDKQMIGNTFVTLFQRMREIMRRGMFSNTLLRGTMQCIQTWTGCTLDSAMGATGGASSSSFTVLQCFNPYHNLFSALQKNTTRMTAFALCLLQATSPPNISTCIRQMSDCTRDAANNSPIGTLLQPIPPTSGKR